MTIRDWILYFGYPTVFLLMIVDFVKCLRGKAKWRNLFIFETIALLVAALIYHWAVYRIVNPPSGDIIDGLNYSGEMLLSWLASGAYGIMLGISVVTKLMLYVCFERRNKDKINPTQ